MHGPSIDDKVVVYSTLGEISMASQTRTPGNGSNLSELIGTYLDRVEHFEPASYTLSSVKEESVSGTTLHSMARLAHVYDRLQRLDKGPAMGEFYVNASA